MKEKIDQLMHTLEGHWGDYNSEEEWITYPQEFWSVSPEIRKALVAAFKAGTKASLPKETT